MAEDEDAEKVIRIRGTALLVPGRALFASPPLPMKPVWQTGLPTPGADDAPNDAASAENFIKKVIWSPDDTFLLASTEGRELVTWIWGSDADETVDSSPALHDSYRLAETVHDICWYPWMRMGTPESICFLAASRDTPVHLVETIPHLRIRSSYLVHDHLDQVSTPYCCLFTPEGGHILAGGLRYVHLFDVHRPGRALRLLGSSPTFSTALATRDPVSALASRKDTNYIIAAGTFGGRLALYDHRQPEDSLIMQLQRESVERIEPRLIQHGQSWEAGLAATIAAERQKSNHHHAARAHRNGITQIEFSPDGWSLYTAARREDYIVRWDLRSPRMPLTRYRQYGPRVAHTNQRIYFSLSSSRTLGGRDGTVDSADHGLLLYSGDQQGNIWCFGQQNGHEGPLVCSSEAPVNCVSLSGSSSLMASSHGGRKVRSLGPSVGSTSSSNSDSDSDSKPPSAAPPSPSLLRVWRVNAEK